MIRDLEKAPTKSTPAITNVSRRGFVIGVGAGSLVLAIGLPRASLAEEAKKYAGDGMPHGLRDDPKIFVAIAPDGTVTVVCHRSEMGQGVRTSLPMIVADELEADWTRVKVAQAPGDEERFGNQDTDGSRSTRHHFHALRHVGAAARTMLVLAAAKQWGVPEDQVEASNQADRHQVRKEDRLWRGRRRGRRAAGAGQGDDQVQAGRALPLYRQGRDRHRRQHGHHDGQDALRHRHAARRHAPRRGRARAGLWRHGRVLRRGRDAQGRGRAQGRRHRSDASALGVHAAGRRRGDRRQHLGRDPGPREAQGRVGRRRQQAAYSSDTYKAGLEAAARKPGQVVRNDGDVDAAMGNAARKIEAEYYVPHLAHASMEPPAATARIVGGKCEAWACVQSPQAARDRLAKRLGMPAENVTVNVTLLGGGFGRKSKPDFVVEAGLCRRRWTARRSR